MNTIAKRFHPRYTKHKSVWERDFLAYCGGSDYIASALIKHLSETEQEFRERLDRSYYFNYPRAIAERITQYALSVDPTRQNADPELVEDWSRTGLRVGEVMRQASTMLNIFGCCGIYVGSPAYEGEMDMERARRERIRPFATVLSPLSIVDWAYGADGLLLWVLIEEEHTSDADPMEDRSIATCRRLWERDRWRLFDEDGKELGTGVNPTGRVPLVEISEPNGFAIGANHWFEDVVRISDAILNNESEAQMNIVKQMFGMLVVSEGYARAASAGGKDKDKDSKGLSNIISRSMAIIESVEENGISRYISPEGVPTAAIRTENANLKQELYDVVGLAIQSRSKEAQTAESKAWDFNNVSQFLANRADLLEQAELEVWQLMHGWDKSVTVPKVTYNRKFAVRDLGNSISGLLQLSNIPGAGIEYQKQIVRAAVDLIESLTSISDEDKKAILDEVERMQPAPVPEFNYDGVDEDSTDSNKGGDQK